MTARHVVIGTAGHVDHGKTALVRMLTGTDTDRWEEEKRRGITIDLGFASYVLEDGITASVVDVPGHEDFVRNMVAGATGIDLALLVVAADEGVMPQTEEHLAIIELLAVPAGVVAVTKADLVEREWLELVEADVTERLASSPVAWERPVAVSAVASTGGEDLRRALTAAAAQATQRSTDDLFRMPVDRRFSVAGAGTVVTGTTWSGSVSVGEAVRVLPGDVRTRVRSVEVHGVPRERAEPGRRTALALPNVAREQAPRGAVIVSGDVWRETRVVDVMVTLLPNSKALTQRSRVRLHLGTAEVMARVTPESDAITPGNPGGARLRLEEPIVARWGDRAVIRSYSPVTTIGGCVVVDPWPELRPRRPASLLALADPTPTRLRSFVSRSASGIPIDDLAVRLGLHPGEAGQVVRDAAADGILEVSNRLVMASVVADAEAAILRTLEGYHRDKPLERGMSREHVRASTHTVAIVDVALHRLQADQRIALEGDTVRLASFRAGFTPAQHEDGGVVLAALADAGREGLTAGELNAKVSAGREIAEFFVRELKAERVGGERYYERSILESVQQEVVAEIQRLGGRATPSELRAATGLTRKYLIPILEWLDARRVTVREGDARRLGPEA